MDLVGLLLTGVVLLCGSLYAAWTFWSAWQEARKTQEKTSGAAVPASTWLQHGLTLVVSLVFLSVAVSLCLSIAQRESYARAVEQLKTLGGENDSIAGIPWGEHGNKGTLHTSMFPEGRIVTGASLTYIEFDNSDLEELTEKYPNIYWFILSGTQVDDRAMPRLAKMEKLSSLVLTDTCISDHGVAAFLNHRGLRELDLARTAITDKSLQVVRTMRVLERLSLSGTDVTDEGLEVLKGHAGLRALNIAGTRISDAVVPTLATLWNLETLRMTGCRVSDDAIVRLQNSLPKCKIVSDSRRNLETADNGP